MKKLREELAARSLATVSTARLVDLTLKVGEEWQGVIPELTLGIEEDPFESLNKSLKKTVMSWSA